MRNFDQIKALAASKKIKLSEVAERSGITYQQLNRIIRTESTSIDTLQKIADALGVPMSLFLDDGKQDARPQLVQTATGEYATQIAGDHTHIGGCASLDKALEEIAAQRRLVENAQTQLSAAQEQINRLITLLENKLTNG